MEDYYYELVVKVSAHQELYADFLSDTLPIGFEEFDGGFIIRSEEELDTIVWGLEQFTEALQKALGMPIDIECTQQKLKNSDWVEAYQKSIAPLQIDNFYIHPTWDAPREDLINIAIDPALAFGTGHHPTTASSLRAVGRYVKEGQNVIDVGCGSGILGIGAIKLGAKVDACDTDPVSVANSLENAQINGVAFENLWEGSCSLAKNRYDVVVANIVADVLTFIANDLKKVLKPEGILILSGILDKYESKVMNHYKDCEMLERIQQDEWVTLVLKKQ
ncbi:MAG: 50S ribosomal protein L11 methyltransferase [Thiovulaceae bacterium]|jgi:ribosomal protein L11 methyltransferase|nr:50S ribosomal protein L11 methyltransferase [Sulfurimonadaceae bacterium]MDD3817625.1 50S ribosomal protein L11 methyltransferase [Sulfurimonadaceae bacterium]